MRCRCERGGDVKRIWRHILSALTLLSLVLCVAGATLWVRSYFVTDQFIRGAYDDVDDRSYWIVDVVLSGRGGIGVNRIVQGFRAGDRYVRKLPFHTTLPAAEYPDFHVWVG